jgi:hypothetical protein
MVACNRHFDYPFASVRDLEIRTVADRKSGRPVVSEVLVDGEPTQPTDRFWLSLYARYGFNKSVFKYFSHQEVFRRIGEVESRDRLRLCLERDEQTGKSRLLAVSNPARAIVRHDDLLETLGRCEGSNIRYCDGVVESTHSPRLGDHAFKIGGDEFCNRFVMSAPVDGFGLPSIYLSLLRQICSNGMVAYSPTFRSTLALGRGEDSAIFSIVRALDGFGSDEGYAALRERFESATKSWASVYEAQSLYRLLAKMLTHGNIRRDSVGVGESMRAEALLDDNTPSGEVPTTGDGSRVGVGTPIISAFHAMTGDVSQIYGLTNVDALSVKRQRTLPVNCRVYDLLNFASEIATHHATGFGPRVAQGWIGTLISKEYDLENSCDAFDDFRDFFLERKLNGEVAMDLQRISS